MIDDCEIDVPNLDFSLICCSRRTGGVCSRRTEEVCSRRTGVIGCKRISRTIEAIFCSRKVSV